MQLSGRIRGPSRILLSLAVAGAAALAQSDSSSLKEGSIIQLAGRSVTVRKVDAVPYVESEFTRRFRFDSADNPKLKELRQRYQLDAVVARGQDEFDRQVLLLDWVHHRFKKFGRPSVEARGALEILQAIDEGHTFFCSQYAHAFVSAAASLGWVDRELALRRHQDPPGGGSSEHSTTEIWSNQYRKWIMMDPTAKMYLEKDGVPLNAEPEKIRVTLQTMTPNFRTYQVRLDGGPWSASGESLIWNPHAGLNRLEAKTVNRFGVESPISTVEVEQ